MTTLTVNNYRGDNRAAALKVLDNLEETEYGYTAQDEERVRRRRERINQMKRQKEKQLRMRKLAVPLALVLLCCIMLITVAVKTVIGKHTTLKEQNAQSLPAEQLPETSLEAERKPKEKVEINSGKEKVFGFVADVNLACTDITESFLEIQEKQLAFIEAQGLHTLGGKSKEPVLVAQSDENTIGSIGDSVSENIILIDVESGRILAQQDAMMRISPASMTKILTVLVAAEHITDAEDTFEITIDITDYSFSHRCSNAGFEVGECVTVKDLFYGTILPSGADAAVGLAKYVAGSQEEFVKLMNEKLDELGISETTHFTNCVGVYDDNHYSTVYDMAVIMKAAYDNPFCREILSRHMYTTSSTAHHPDGIPLSNLFLRRIEDRDTHGEVLCAKTGYVDQSGSCAASLSIGNDGKLYICVSAHSTSSWRCIRDHVAFYQYFLP